MGEQCGYWNASSENFGPLINTGPTFISEEDDDLVKISDLKVKSEKCNADELNFKFNNLIVESLDVVDSKYSGKKTSRLERIKSFESDLSDVEDNIDDDAHQCFARNKCERNRSVGISHQKETAFISPLFQNGRNHETINVDIVHKSVEDVKKGCGIKNQLLLWDLLLECRLKFQNCLMIANQLPRFEQFKKFKNIGGQKFENLLKRTEVSLLHLLNSSLELQDVLLHKNEDFSKISNSCTIPIGILSVTHADKSGNQERPGGKIVSIYGIANEIELRHKKMKPFRNKIIQKWNEKTRVIHVNSKNVNSSEQSVLKQIEHALLEKPYLVQRTKIKRSNYHILGESDHESPVKIVKANDVTNTSENNLHMQCEKKKNECIEKEIFDDDDFYHQLLSDYIKKKYDVYDPKEISKQWHELEKLRSKMKRRIDTRATKGRKIRYVVHQKLVNFMMPLDNTVIEGSRTELFNSLFGNSLNS